MFKASEHKSPFSFFFFLFCFFLLKLFKERSEKNMGLKHLSSPGCKSLASVQGGTRLSPSTLAAGGLRTVSLGPMFRAVPVLPTYHWDSLLERFTAGMKLARQDFSFLYMEYPFSFHCVKIICFLETWKRVQQTLQENHITWNVLGWKVQSGSVADYNSFYILRRLNNP